ncbi:uncharacterized protein C8orf58 homolog isoform X2 [Lissotriton helveticus]
MMRRQRKFNLQRLWSKDGPGSCSSGGCLVLTSTSTYRRLCDNEERVISVSPSRMDGDLDRWEPPEAESLGESIGQQLGADGFFQAFDFYAKGHRLAKSESEDSGVEMGSGEASPSTSESDNSFTLDAPELQQKLNWPSLGKDQVATREGAQSEQDWGDVVPQKVNTKLEQAMQRSKQTRTSVERPGRRAPIATLTRRHSGSLPTLDMGTFQAGALQNIGASMDTLKDCQEPCRASGPRRVKLAQLRLQSLQEDCQQEVEMENNDPMVLPGQGLRYLEHVCQVMEKMAELQRNNRSLRRQKRAIEARLRGTASEQEICGAASPLEASQPDLHLARQTDASTSGGPRVSFRERSMSTSDVGNLWDFAPIQGTRARPSAAILGTYVSTPDLKDTPDGWIPSNVPYLRQKSEPTQWERVKELISKIARRAVEPPNTLRKASFNRRPHPREDAVLENPRPASRKVFLPNIVVKKQKRQRPPVQ